MRANKADFDAIEEVIGKIEEAFKANDSSIVKPYYADPVNVYGSGDGALAAVPAQIFFDNIDAIGDAGKEIRFRTDILEVEETVAVVRVIEDNVGGVDFTNYFTLLKLSEGWKIVNQVYNQNK